MPFLFVIKNSYLNIDAEPTVINIDRIFVRLGKETGPKLLRKWRTLYMRTSRWFNTATFNLKVSARPSHLKPPVDAKFIAILLTQQHPERQPGARRATRPPTP